MEIRARRGKILVDLAQVWRDTHRGIRQKDLAVPSLLVHEVSLTFDTRQHAASGDTPCRISLTTDDSLGAALRVQTSGLKPMVLDFASANLPGGAVASGVNAQEECIFRRTSISLALDPAGKRPACYPIAHGCCIVAQNVAIVKSEEYEWMSAPFPEIDVVVCPAEQKPACSSDRYVNSDIMECRALAVLQAAIANGNRALILGAWGCGGFRNPPLGLAEIFRTLLCDKGYAACFDYVEFAVPADKHYQPFFAVLKNVLQPRLDQGAAALTPQLESSMEAQSNVFECASAPSEG